jgi:hypothetical protein
MNPDKESDRKRALDLAHGAKVKGVKNKIAPPFHKERLAMQSESRPIER